MDAAATPHTRKKTIEQILAFALIGGASYLFAPLAPVLSLLLALIVCPAYAAGQTLFAALMPLVPAGAWLLGGGDTALGLMMPLSAYLSLPALSRRGRRLNLHGQAAAIAAASVAGALAMLWRVSAMLGGSLFPNLANAIVSSLEQSVFGGSVLYRLVSLGILSLPDAFTNAHAFKLGSLVLMDPALQRELLNMLRLRLNEGFQSWVPSLLMQGTLITGVFAALRSARARGFETADGQTVPLFRNFELTRTEQGYAFFLCIVTLLTAFAGGSFPALLSSLAYAAFSTVYQLLGAAVLIFLLARRHAERAPLYGLLAALLYLVFPLALFLLGLIDQFVHLRSENPYHPKEE